MTALYDGDSNRVFTATRAKRQTEKQILVKVNKSPDTSADGRNHSLFWYGFSQNMVQCLSEASIGAAKVWDRLFDMLETTIFQKNESNKKKDSHSKKGLKAKESLNEEASKNQDHICKRPKFGDVFLPQTIKEENTYYEIRNYINDVNRDNAQVLASYDEHGKIRESYDYGLERLNGYRHQEGSVQTYWNDARGSITGLSNETGLETASINYTVQGNPQNKVLNLPFGYNGEQSDITGFQYLRARYYDPSTASMLTEDTYAGEETDPLSQNRYTYARNNPINYQDPSGHFPKILSDIGKAIKKKATNVVKAVVKKGKEVVNQVSTFFTGAKKQIVKTAKAAREVVEEKAEQLVETVSTSYKEAKKNIKKGINTGVRNATHVLKNVGKAIEKNTRPFCTAVSRVAGQAWEFTKNVDWAKIGIGALAITGAILLTVASGGTLGPVLILGTAGMALGSGGISAAITLKNGGSMKDAAKEFSDVFMWSGIGSLTVAGSGLISQGTKAASSAFRQKAVERGFETTRDTVVDTAQDLSNNRCSASGVVSNLVVNLALSGNGQSLKKEAKGNLGKAVHNIKENINGKALSKEVNPSMKMDLQFFAKSGKKEATQTAAKQTEKNALKGGLKTTLDYVKDFEKINGKYFAPKNAIDEIGKIEAKGIDFSDFTKKAISTRKSTEGGFSTVYNYSDSSGVKFVIHEVTDAASNILHRDFDAVRIESGQLINKLPK